MWSDNRKLCLMWVQSTRPCLPSTQLVIMCPIDGEPWKLLLLRDWTSRRILAERLLRVGVGHIFNLTLMVIVLT